MAERPKRLRRPTEGRSIIRRWIILVTVVVLAALLAQLAPPSSSPALATNLCGNTGSSAGPFDIQAYEAVDWRTTYARTLELAGFNQLLPDVSNFNLPLLEYGPRSSGSADQRAPYIPPTILKAIAWIESSWVQADWSVPYGGVGSALISHDCGYGLTQVTSGMQNVSGVPSLDQAMIGGHYGFNIARGARILAEKWNLAPNYRPLVGDRDPNIVENWYYAVWSYNGFSFSNHPLNPSFNLSRSPYLCNGTQPRSNYPFQELIFGCVTNPPIVGGTRLWDPLPVTLPNLSDPALSLDRWNACSGSYNCAGMDMPTPGGGSVWWMQGIGGVQWGDAPSGDIPAPGDYNGDGKTDLAVWRPSTNAWYIYGLSTIQWGASLPGDIPVPGDYDGDGKEEPAVWRPSTNSWYIYGLPTIQWGTALPGDVPVPGDYNGDGKTEPAIWRPSTNSWYIYGLPAIRWGASLPGDVPVPGDYDGDGKTDPAIWRPSTNTTYIYGVPTIQWGASLPGDIPVPGDYNGDGRTEPAIWRPSTNIWYIYGLPATQWGDGGSGDIPVPGDYDGDGKTDPAVWRSAKSSHIDPTTVSGNRAQAIGVPVLSASPTNFSLVTASGSQSASISVTVSNVGTGPLVWRLSPSVSWLNLSRTQGVSLGTDIGSQASSFTFYVNALSLASGIYSGQIIIESLYPSGSPLSITIALQVPGDIPVPGDYNGDGKTNLTVWRPAINAWYPYGLSAIQWGAALPGDVPVPGDYNGDGKTEPAIWRPSSNTWYIYGVPDIQWGSSLPGDVPVPGDYNGDGKTEPAIWRPSSNTWYISGVPDIQWGSSLPGDVPVPGDYNGDGKTEPAIWRPSSNTWYIYGVPDIQWGASSPGDMPVPGDYNGDGTTEPAIWRPSTDIWYIFGLPDVQWGDGDSDDILVPGDYSGDGKTEPAVWRPSSGVWYVLGSAGVQWGLGT